MRIYFLDIFYLFVFAAIVLHGIFTFKKRIIIYRYSISYIGQVVFGLVMAVNFTRYVGLDIYSIITIIIILIIISVVTIYNVKYIKPLSYFNSEPEVIENIVIDILSKHDIKYTIDEYHEIVLENSKSKIIVKENEVRMKRYRDLQNYEALQDEIYKNIIERGFTKRSLTPLIEIFSGIAFIVLFLFK